MELRTAAWKNVLISFFFAFSLSRDSVFLCINKHLFSGIIHRKLCVYVLFCSVWLFFLLFLKTVVLVK